MKNFVNIATIATEVNNNFENICADHPDLILELSTKGELITLSATGFETGEKNCEIAYQLVKWNKKTN